MHCFVSPVDKNRKCLYAADGYTENLSWDELKALAKYEREPSKTLQLGSIGWQFQKQFPDKKWYSGVVIKILNGVGMSCFFKILCSCSSFYLQLTIRLSNLLPSVVNRKWERSALPLPWYVVFFQDPLFLFQFLFAAYNLSF